MTRILYLSRHDLQPRQKKDLHRIFGDYKVIQVSKKVQNGKEVEQLMKKHSCEELIAVLPLHIKKQVTDLGIEMIEAEMVREFNENTNDVKFHHSHYNRINDINIEKEGL